MKIHQQFKDCDHPFILKYLDSFSIKTGNAFVVTEYANLGSLEDYFNEKGAWDQSKGRNRFSDEQKLECMTQIMLGANYLH